MKKNKVSSRFVIIVFSIFLLTGCIHTRFISMVSDSDRTGINISAINSSGIKLYFSNRPEKEYSEIFYIMSKGTIKYTKTKDLVQELKTKAQHLGADAVINIIFSTSVNSWGADVLMISGLAVKFK